MPAPKVSSRRVDLKPDLPQYHATAVSGDEQLTSSHHPGSFPTTGLEGLMACWGDGAWLQGTEDKP